jgi:hypothetical protein
MKDADAFGIRVSLARIRFPFGLDEGWMLTLSYQVWAGFGASLTFYVLGALGVQPFFEKSFATSFGVGGDAICSPLRAGAQGRPAAARKALRAG